MKTAIANLPNYYSANNMQGRATKIAIYTMQADVFMTLQDFNSAKNSLENILDYANQNKEKLDLENDVLQIYASDNPMGEKKSFFAAQYNNGATVVANPLMGRCIPASSTIYSARLHLSRRNRFYHHCFTRHQLSVNDMGTLQYIQSQQ